MIYFQSLIFVSSLPLHFNTFFSRKGLCCAGLYKGEFWGHERKALWFFIHTVLSERAAVEHNSGEVVS
jgi:hypothetical protein